VVLAVGLAAAGGEAWAAAVVFPWAGDAAVPSAPLPTVHVIATGGTILAQRTDRPGQGYTAGVLPLDDLLGSLPRLSALAELSTAG
jgi:L-asparaginase/Glu-tRNA(Gln) amidotransferase subunit D